MQPLSRQQLGRRGQIKPMAVCGACAGLAGYAWVAVLHQLMRLSFTATLLAANITAALWLLVYYRLLPAASSMEEVRYQAVTGSDRAGKGGW